MSNEKDKRPNIADQIIDKSDGVQDAYKVPLTEEMRKQIEKDKEYLEIQSKLEAFNSEIDSIDLNALRTSISDILLDKHLVVPDHIDSIAAYIDEQALSSNFDLVAISQDLQNEIEKQVTELDSAYRADKVAGPKKIAAAFQPFFDFDISNQMAELDSIRNRQENDSTFKEAMLNKYEDRTQGEQKAKHIHGINASFFLLGFYHKLESEEFKIRQNINTLGVLHLTPVSNGAVFQASTEHISKLLFRITVEGSSEILIPQLFEKLLPADWLLNYKREKCTTSDGCMCQQPYLRGLTGLSLAVAANKLISVVKAYYKHEVLPNRDDYNRALLHAHSVSTLLALPSSTVANYIANKHMGAAENLTSNLSTLVGEESRNILFKKIKKAQQNPEIEEILFQRYKTKLDAYESKKDAVDDLVNLIERRGLNKKNGKPFYSWSTIDRKVIPRFRKKLGLN